MRTIYFILALLVIISFGIGVIVFFMSPKHTDLTTKEKQNALTKLLGRHPILTQKVRSTALVQYSGTYLSFSYPAAATEYVYDAPIDKSGFVLEHFHFQEHMPQYHFVLQVEKQNADALRYDDVSGIRLRRTQKDIYTESLLHTNSGNWITFVKKDDAFEKTAFLLHGDKLFTLAITGSDPSIEKIFDDVLQSVILKKD